VVIEASLSGRPGSRLPPTNLNGKVAVHCPACHRNTWWRRNRTNGGAVCWDCGTWLPWVDHAAFDDPGVLVDYATEWTDEGCDDCPATYAVVVMTAGVVIYLTDRRDDAERWSPRRQQARRWFLPEMAYREAMMHDGGAVVRFD
jgi:hypothetical protein